MSLERVTLSEVTRTDAHIDTTGSHFAPMFWATLILHQKPLQQRQWEDPMSSQAISHVALFVLQEAIRDIFRRGHPLFLSKQNTTVSG